MTRGEVAFYFIGVCIMWGTVTSMIVVPLYRIATALEKLAKKEL